MSDHLHSCSNFEPTPQCAAFNRAFALGNALFLAMMSADEGRGKPSLGTSLLKAAYNAIIFPIGILLYRSPKRRSRSFRL